MVRLMHPTSTVRRSPRFPSFDYTTAGAYFVTVVTQDRERLFGHVSEATSKTQLNDVGTMIERWWNELLAKFPSVLLDEHVVMPDHFHAIVLLQCSPCLAARPVSLPTVMHWFKTKTTGEYFRRVRSDHWPRVRGRLWQRSYYDHIIRSEEELLEIRSYIECNPGALLERFAGTIRQPTETCDE